MKIRTDALVGEALNWAVTKIDYEINFDEVWSNFRCDCLYAEDWSAGGPIIEREKIGLEHFADGWYAALTHKDEQFDGVMLTGAKGPTPLVAAMRCYVESKLGDEVDVPDELVQTPT